MAKKVKKPVIVPTEAELQDAVLAIDTARTEAVNAIAIEFERLFSSYFDRVRSIIASNQALRAADALDLQTATVVMNDLHQILIDAGLESVVHGFATKFPALAQTAADYYAPFGLDASLAGVAKETLAAWVDFSSNELIKILDASLIPPVRSALLQVNFGNQTRDQLIQQLVALQPSLTTNDARILVNESFSQFQRAVVVQKGDSVGLEIYQFLGPDDAITSPQCHAMLKADLHGAPGILYKDEITPHLHPNLERYGINPLIEGGHPNCFLPGTKVYGKILRASKACYSGEAITIHTRKGHRLSVTPNHPILTPRGFVPAATLNPGDQVVSYGGDAEASVTATLTGESNEYDRPALIEDVFETILAKGFLSRCRPTPLDLHGDAQPWNGDIDIVDMNRVLPLNGDAVCLKSDCDNVLQRVDHRRVIPVTERTLDLNVNGVDATSAGVPGVSALTSNQSGVGLDVLPLRCLTLGTGTFFDSAFTECTLNSSLSDTMLALQLHDRFSVEIIFDELIAVERHPYTGHVYDLESNTGWVIADGVCASNCRHQWSPITLEYAQKLGFVEGASRGEKAVARE